VTDLEVVQAIDATMAERDLERLATWQTSRSQPG
jgi:hypothetical protein